MEWILLGLVAIICVLLLILWLTKLQLKDTFNALAGEALKSNNQAFLDLANQRFDNLKIEAQKTLEQKEESFTALLKPLDEMVREYKKSVDEMKVENAKSFTSIGDTLTALSTEANKLSIETIKLNNVLGTAKQRGRWGEITVRKILELAGLNSVTDFSEQSRDQSGNKPDFVIKLPNNRNIIIDSKFNADAYIRAMEASSEEERNKHLKDHARSVMDTVKDLAKKKYNESDEYSADFVIMFVPNDSLLAAAAEQQVTIVEDAMSSKIVLATPSTLYAMLKVVALGWQEFELNQNAEKVKEIGQELFKRARSLVEHIANLRAGLQRATKAFNDFIGSFQTHLLPQLNRFKEYGVVSDQIDSLDSIPDELRDLNYGSKYLADTSAATSQKSVGPADLP